jgi:hypothetical protein
MDLDLRIQTPMDSPDAHHETTDQKAGPCAARQDEEAFERGTVVDRMGLKAQGFGCSGSTCM